MYNIFVLSAGYYILFHSEHVTFKKYLLLAAFMDFRKSKISYAIHLTDRFKGQFVGFRGICV